MLGLTCSLILTNIFRIEKDPEVTVSAIPLKDVSTTTINPSSVEEEKATTQMTTDDVTSKHPASTKMAESSNDSTFVPIVTYRSVSKHNQR